MRPAGPDYGDEVYLDGHFESAVGYDSWRVARRACQTCEFDIDNDAQINSVDSGLVQSNFGCEVGTGDEECDRCDIDLNCVVNPVDSGLVQGAFGTCP